MSNVAFNVLVFGIVVLVQLCAARSVKKELRYSCENIANPRHQIAKRSAEVTPLPVAAGNALQMKHVIDTELDLMPAAGGKKKKKKKKVSHTSYAIVS